MTNYEAVMLAAAQKASEAAHDRTHAKWLARRFGDEIRAAILANFDKRFPPAERTNSMSDFSNEEIVRLAALMIKRNASGQKEDADEFDRGLAQPHSDFSVMLIFCAEMLLEGKSFSVSCIGSFARVRSLARHMGATEEMTVMSGEPPRQKFTFRPPTRKAA